MTASTTPAWLRWTLGAASLLALGTFLFVVLARITYPYELEFMTGACLDHVDRILDGQPMYVEPTPDFVTWLYGPFYFYCCAAIASVVGDSSLILLRCVSFASALLSTALAFVVVQRMTASRLAGWVAVGLWTATYGLVGTWWDIGRVDSMFTTWTMVVIALLWLGKAWPSAVAAGVVMTIAYMTKQTALVLAPAFAVGVALQSVPRAITYVGVFAATLIPSAWILDVTTDGWFSYYTWEVPSSHGYQWSTWWQYFPGDTWAMAPMVAASAWYVLRLFATDRARRALSIGAFGSGLWLATCLSRAHVGGAENVLIPTHLGFAVIAALAFGESMRDRFWRVPIGVLLLLQFPLAAYSPSHYLPTAADREVGDRLTRILEQTEGPVMIPQHGFWARHAGHDAAAHVLAVIDIMRGPDPERGEQLRADYLDYTWARDCDLVVLDEPVSQELLPLLSRDPTKIEWDYEPLFEEELEADGTPKLQSNGRPLFMPVVGLQGRPKQVWRRKRD